MTDLETPLFWFDIPIQAVRNVDGRENLSFVTIYGKELAVRTRDISDKPGHVPADEWEAPFKVKARIMLRQIDLGIREANNLPEGWTYQFFKNDTSGNNTDCGEFGEIEETRTYHELRYMGKLAGTLTTI